MIDTLKSMVYYWTRLRFSGFQAYSFPNVQAGNHTEIEDVSCVQMECPNMTNVCCSHGHPERRATEDPKLTPRHFAGFHQNHWSIRQLCPSLQPSQLSGSGVHRDVRQLLFLLEGPHAIADLCSNLGPWSAKVCQVESIRNQQVCFMGPNMA